MQNETDLILREIAAINQKIDGILARMDSVRARLSHADHLLLAMLLPALAGRYGSDVFTSGQIASDPTFKVLLNSDSAQRLGNLLARTCGIDISGLTIQHAHAEHNATLWQVVRVTRRLPEPLSHGRDLRDS